MIHLFWYAIGVIFGFIAFCWFAYHLIFDSKILLSKNLNK